MPENKKAAYYEKPLCRLATKFSSNCREALAYSNIQGMHGCDHMDITVSKQESFRYDTSNHDHRLESEGLDSLARGAELRVA